MAGLYLRSNSVVEDLSHTWLLRLIPNEQTTTSGGLQKGKALRTKRKTEQTLLHTHTHTCMYKYMGKTRPRPLNDKALPVWNNAHITTHHHHSAKRKFSVAPILSSRSCSEQKRNPLVRITFRQTRYYTAWLLRQHYAETGGRYDTSFHSEQTVEKHKQCLWFKAEANRKAECFVF